MRRFITSLLVGLAVGAIVGLYLGWVQFPVQTVDSPMRALSRSDKDHYTIMVAQAYELDGDATEAIHRLQPLGLSDVPGYVRDVTERYISESGIGSESDIRHLVALSRALGFFTPAMQGFIAAPVPASATPRTG